MGTRGSYGFRVGGEERLMYNHSDSYPEWLGVRLAQELAALIKERGLDTLRAQASAIEDVHERQFTEADGERWQAFTNNGVGGKDDVWYQAMREAQGTLTPFLDAGQMLIDNAFIRDTWCEYSYVVDLDDKVIAFYGGNDKVRDIPFEVITQIADEFADEPDTMRDAFLPLFSIPETEAA